MILSLVPSLVSQLFIHSTTSEKNTRSTSWSEKDRQHTFLGVVLLVVGICNAMDMLCFGDAFSDCLDKYVFRSVEGKSLTKRSQCCKHLHFLCSGSMGLD